MSSLENVGMINLYLSKSGTWSYSVYNRLNEFILSNTGCETPMTALDEIATHLTSRPAPHAKPPLRSRRQSRQPRA